MGAPSSGIIAEIFLQHVENSHLASLAQKKNIINYFHYVDNILLIFHPNHTHIQAILNDFNAITPKLHFTAEIEDNSLNYLDISIRRIPRGLGTYIYRKIHIYQHHHPLHIQSPHTTQTRSNKISIQQTKHSMIYTGKNTNMK